MFGFKIDKRTLLMILGIMIILWIMRTSTSALLELLYALPGVLVAFTFHEYAHALAADKLRR